MKNEAWANLIRKAYLQFQVWQGEARSRQEFAVFLGIDPTVYSQWVSGLRYPKQIEILDGIAARLEEIDRGLRSVGVDSDLRNEAYTALGFSPRMPTSPLLRSAVRDLEQLPPDIQALFVEAIKETARKRREKEGDVTPAWFHQLAAQG